MVKAIGGKNLYGYSIGILVLETKFPRIPGDMANATTWDFPVLYKIIKKAAPDQVVRKGAKGLLERFIKGAQELEREGVRAITTNCGFLALFQNELAASVNIPRVHLKSHASPSGLFDVEAFPKSGDYHDSLEVIDPTASFCCGSG